MFDNDGPDRYTFCLYKDTVETWLFLLVKRPERAVCFVQQSQQFPDFEGRYVFSIYSRGLNNCMPF